MKFQPKLLTLLLTAVALISFGSCHDPGSILLNQVLQDIPAHVSPYTGGLQRIGTVSNFGLNLDHPVAIEWNGEQLYMLASQGINQNKSQYLYTLNRETGAAKIVNPSARDLGGSFKGGRTFTQVYAVSPWDMAWIPAPKDSRVSQTGNMIAICPVMDALVVIRLNTGIAGRIHGQSDYCLRTENGDKIIGGAGGLSYNGSDLYMIGTARYSNRDGRPPFAELFQVSGNFRCAIRISENPPQQFDVGESTPYALAFDTEYLYMSGANTQALYIINQQTGKAHFIATWHFTPMPKGFRVNRAGDIHDIENNINGNIWITGIAFDGLNMYAVDAFTNGLYKLEKR